MEYVVNAIDLPGRVRLAYAEQGDPEGIPLILLHGVTDSWRSFEHVLPFLPKSLHAFAISQRGHGDSEKPAAGYRTREFSEDIAAFVQERNLGPVVVVGHSMGGTHALRFAIDYPEQTRALVLVSTFASYRPNTAAADFYHSEVANLSDPIPEALVREFQQSTVTQPMPADQFEMVVRESMKVPAHVWRAAFSHFLDNDFVDDIHTIKCPTLILWGDQDAFATRYDQDELSNRIRDARLLTYEGIGHALHWEAAERFATDLTTFIATLDSASPNIAEPTSA